MCRTDKKGHGHAGEVTGNFSRSEVRDGGPKEGKVKREGDKGEQPLPFVMKVHSHGTVPADVQPQTFIGAQNML